MRGISHEIVTNPRTAVLCAAALILGLTLALPAHAYTTGQVEWLNFPTLKVASDGNNYTGVTGIGYGWEGRVDIQSSGLPRVKSWSLYPRLHFESLDETLSFELYKQGKSYPVGQRPQNVHRTVGSIFPNTFVDDFATLVCNRNLEVLMNQGHPRQQVLAQDRLVAVDLWGSLDIDITVGDPIIEAFHKDIEIRCEKSPIQPPKPPKPGSNSITGSGDFVLDNANLVIVPSNYSGKCPKDLTLLMEVQGNHKGTFEARIESTEGWKSTKFTHQTNEFDANSGLWERQFSEAFTVPVDKPAPSGGGGGGIPPGPGGFQAPKPEEEPPFPSGGVPKGPGGITAKDPGPNVHKQSLRLVAQANGKTVYSDWRQYNVVCDPQPSLPPATTAFLPGGSGPKPPKPDDTDPKPGKEPKGPGNPGRPAPKPSGIDDDKPAAPAKPSRRAAPSSLTQKPAKAQSKPQSATAAAKLQAPAGGQPDLRVVKARRPVGSPNTIEFLVENAGKGAAGRSKAQLTCERAEGGFETWSAPVPPVPAAGQRWVKTSPRQAKPVRTPVRGCEIRIDPTNAVRESDERNNDFACADCAAGRGR